LDVRHTSTSLARHLKLLPQELRVALLAGKDVSMLTIRLLGAQGVLDGTTGHIRTVSSRTLALLGLLIAHTGRPQDRATIAGQFWPEPGNGRALTNLRRELHDLRRILGDDESLEITTGQLCWHDRGRHDIDLNMFLAAFGLRPRSAIRTSDHAQQAVRDGGKRRLATWKAGSPGQPLYDTFPVAGSGLSLM
jgi:ABC-type proline/glycine betaine transport system permease subunit